MGNDAIGTIQISIAPWRPSQLGAGGGLANLLAVVDSKIFSELEHLKIWSALGLMVAQYKQAVFVPELFTMMLTEGRTLTK
jgi:hypothetical protein